MNFISCKNVEAGLTLNTAGLISNEIITRFLHASALTQLIFSSDLVTLDAALRASLLLPIPRLPKLQMQQVLGRSHFITRD
jgi:hypothetical protein